MELSVVIPNYNGALMLSSCIEHVIFAIEKAQIKTFEIIVSDDASTDNSKTVCLNINTAVCRLCPQYRIFGKRKSWHKCFKI